MRAARKYLAPALPNRIGSQKANYCMSATTGSVGQSEFPLVLELLRDLAPLRGAFDQAGFNAAAVAQTLSVCRPGEGLNRPVLMSRTEAPSPYHTLFRLFILGQNVAASAVDLALRPVPWRSLVDAGLLQCDRDGVRSIGRLAPYEQLFLLSDFSAVETPRAPAEREVLGVNPASVLLANLTVRRQNEAVLDLGTGTGIQALLAAQHAASVVGTDLNPRALNFAAFNARLNGCEQLQWRTGPYFEPVAGEQFDLVLANPPYVISPESSRLYRDSGLPADTVSELVVRGAGAHLKEGGFASVLLNWHHASDVDWHERPWSWLTGNGCDGWLLRFSDEEPLSYASKWLADIGRRDPTQYAQRLGQWLQYYESQGIRRIAFGQLTLRRRRAAENWFRCDTLPQIQGSYSCSEQIQRIFAAEDFLNQPDCPASLLQQKMMVAADVVIDQRLTPGKMGWAIDAMGVHFIGGLPFAGNVDTTLLSLLNRCGGSRPLGEVIAAIVAESGPSAGSVRETCLDLARTLMRWGMLVRAT